MYYVSWNLTLLWYSITNILVYTTILCALVSVCKAHNIFIILWNISQVHLTMIRLCTIVIWDITPFTTWLITTQNVTCNITCKLCSNTPFAWWSLCVKEIIDVHMLWSLLTWLLHMIHEFSIIDQYLHVCVYCTIYIFTKLVTWYNTYVIKLYDILLPVTVNMYICHIIPDCIQQGSLAVTAKCASRSWHFA